MTLEGALLGLQAYQVVFLWAHDWVPLRLPPLGPLNDVVAVRASDSRSRLVAVTLIQSVPYTIGLAFSWKHLGGVYPGWLWDWLWISYGLLLAGQLRAWWQPYLVRAEPVRAARYQVMFGRTHAFLPRRNGMVPNTAHVSLHIATLATLVVLSLMGRV